jgi:S1-C subfamily serine protease
MIRQALASLGRSGKSTADIEALVDRKVRRTSARLRRAVVAIVALFVAGAAAGGFFIYRSRAVHVTQINYGAASGGAIAAANRHNVFVLAGYPVANGAVTGPLQGFCTAFLVGPDLLATNAHCVIEGSTGFSSVVALMNGAAARGYPVVQWFTHGGYRDGTLSPDVGLVRVSGTLPTAVVRAGAAELAQVAPGVTVFLYGFPGRLNDTAAPEATFVQGDIGRVTGFDLRVGSFEANTLLQHSAYCTAGTSGSPMFDTSGRVIGINAGGYVEDGQALAGYNFGMRIDLLDPLLRQTGTGGTR